MKYKICKNPSLFGEYMNKRLELNFGPSCTAVLSLVLSKTKHNLTFRIAQKIKLQTLVQFFTKY